MSKIQEVTHSDGWKNWQIALAVGIPAAIVGLYVYKRYKTNSVVNNSQQSAAKSEKQKTAGSQVLKVQGNEHFKSGQYDKAIDCYTKAIESGSDITPDELATFHQNRAAAYEHLKNYVRVISDCTKAIELNPNYTKALNRRAKAYQQTGFLSESLEDVTAACILESFTNQNNIILADNLIKELSQKCASDKMKVKSPVDPSVLTVKSYISSFSHDPIFNNENLKQVVMSKETDQLSPFEKAMRMFCSEDYKDIVSLCTEEINMTQSSYKTEALLLRGSLYLLKGQNQDAMADFNVVLDDSNVDNSVKSNACLKVGKCLTQTNKMTEAVEVFHRAVSLDENNPDVYLHRGQVYLVMENLDMAISDFHKSISINDNVAAAHIHKSFSELRKAIAEQDMSKAEEIIRSFQEILNKFPSCADGYAFYGQALLDLKRFEEADECFKKAIQMEPNNPNSYVHRGILRLSWKEDFDGAFKFIKKGIEIDGNSSFAYQALGTLEFQKGSIDSAIDLLQKAVDYSTNETEMIHLYSILLAAEVQHKVAARLGVSMPSLI